MKKYTPVFGPQELFDGAENCDEYLVAVQHSVGQKTKVSFYPSLVEAFNYVTDFPPRGVVFHRAAMRRIEEMQEPKRWTWEDKKAGRLPEVGSLIMEVESQYGFEFVGVCAGSKRFAVKDVLDGLIYFYNKDVISPIETPAEKAQREEDEWVNKAWSETAVFAGVTQDEHDRLRIHLRHIYRAQLSGELAAPKGGE